METKPTLFISYSNKDEELAHILEDRLKEYGIKIVYDKIIFDSGGDYQKDLLKSLINADAIIVLITSNSISSPYVMKELGMARSVAQESQGKKLLLPIIYGDVEIPNSIKDSYVIYWKDNFEKVIESIVGAVSNQFKNQNTESKNSENDNIEEREKSEITQSIENLKRTKNALSEKEILKRNYWLLKMNPATWEIENLDNGVTTFFNTYYFGEKRPEYYLFKRIKKGDRVLGFASGNYQSIVCEMEVVQEVGPNHAQGESFIMIIRSLINPHIPLNKFRKENPNILARLDQNLKPPELFFELNETSYSEILSSQVSIEVQLNKLFQPYFLTEGDHKETDDKLDFENDYKSFASIIALKRVTPPLAIGLFGNWGSGKSFFMEKLEKEIEKLTLEKDPEYFEHIVPVKFNSWHYSDTNLWASLITQIFESLNNYAQKKPNGQEAIEAIYKELNLTGIQLLETKKKIAINDEKANVLKQQKVEKEYEIERKKKTLNLWRAQDFIKLVFSDPYIQDDFQNIKNQFKDEKLIDNLNEIEEKYSEIDTAKDRVFKSLSLLKENNRGKWKGIWIIAVIFGILGWLAIGPFKEAIQKFINDSIFVSGLIVIWLANLMTQLSPYFSKVNQFYKRLKSLKETVEKEKEKVHLKEHDEIDRLEKEIESLTQEKNILQEEQIQTEERNEKLKKEIIDFGTGKMLANFLIDKSEDETYNKQLGIVSWIRKDFSKLNDLFQNQKIVQAKENDSIPQVQIDRIVLYIDDLDRCNENVVVKVLEAIHLLLAFPLFVVVVGVDPRWLNNALTVKYKNLFGNQIEKGNINENIYFNEAATSYDYLEKIFHIPFALKPINKVGREKLLQYLMRNEMSTNEINYIDSSTVTEALKFEDLTPETNQPSSKDKNEEYIQKNNHKIIKTTRERLVFTDKELEYMQKISPIFGQTPRTINRYVNIYRIIKAHGNLKVVGNFSKDEFMPLMFILAVIVGHSAFAEEFIANIAESSDDIIFSDFLKSLISKNRIIILLKSMDLEIEGMYMVNFKRNLELISRFSFRTILK